jgi:hypothetical protein
MSDVDVQYILGLVETRKKNKITEYFLGEMERLPLTENLTKKLKEFFNVSSSSSMRESFITVLVAVISEENVLNDFLNKYNIIYTTQKSILKSPRFDKGVEGVLFSPPKDSTHYYSRIAGGSEYDPYTKHQLIGTHGFCQTFSIINLLWDRYPKLKDISSLQEGDYVMNAYRALKFISYMIDEINTDLFNLSYHDLIQTEGMDAFDLKKNLKKKDFKDIISLFKPVDMYPVLINSSIFMSNDDANTCYKKLQKNLKSAVSVETPKTPVVRKSPRTPATPRRGTRVTPRVLFTPY